MCKRTPSQMGHPPIHEPGFLLNSHWSGLSRGLFLFPMGPESAFTTRLIHQRVPIPGAKPRLGYKKQRRRAGICLSDSAVFGDVHLVSETRRELEGGLKKSVFTYQGLCGRRARPYSGPKKHAENLPCIYPDRTLETPKSCSSLTSTPGVFVPP